MRPEHLRRLAEEAAGPMRRNWCCRSSPEGQRSTVRQPPGPATCPMPCGSISSSTATMTRDTWPTSTTTSPPVWPPDTLTIATRPATVDVEAGSTLLMGTTVADYRGLWGHAAERPDRLRQPPGGSLRRAGDRGREPGPAARLVLAADPDRPATTAHRYNLPPLQRGRPLQRGVSGTVHLKCQQGVLHHLRQGRVNPVGPPRERGNSG